MRAYDWKKGGRGTRGGLRGLGAVTKKDVAFFKKNAGYIVGERAKGAMALAKAEEAADRLGWKVEWKHDVMGWDGDDEDTPNEVLCAVLKDARGKVRASLCGIGDPEARNKKYARVVEAELAAEALGKTGWSWVKKRVKMARRRDGSMMGLSTPGGRLLSMVGIAAALWLVTRRS